MHIVDEQIKTFQKANHKFRGNRLNHLHTHFSSLLIPLLRKSKVLQVDCVCVSCVYSHISHISAFRTCIPDVISCRSRNRKIIGKGFFSSFPNFEPYRPENKTKVLLNRRKMLSNSIFFGGCITLLTGVIKMIIFTTLLLMMIPDPIDFLKKPGEIFFVNMRSRSVYRGNFSTAIIAFAQVAAAWIEVICSMKLIASLGETNKRIFIWWMAIQPFAIVNLAFISFTEIKKLEMSINILCMLVAIVSSYTTLQIVYLTWIVFHFCSNQEAESSDPIEPPRSENCVDKPPSYEMTQLLFSHE